MNDAGLPQGGDEPTRFLDPIAVRISDVLQRNRHARTESEKAQQLADVIDVVARSVAELANRLLRAEWTLGIPGAEPLSHDDPG